MFSNPEAPLPLPCVADPFDPAPLAPCPPFAPCAPTPLTAPAPPDAPNGEPAPHVKGCGSATDGRSGPNSPAEKIWLLFWSANWNLTTRTLNHSPQLVVWKYGVTPAESVHSVWPRFPLLRASRSAASWVCERGMVSPSFSTRPLSLPG